MHLKDVDPVIAARERSGQLDLMAATQAGLFPSLGDGGVGVAEVVEELESSGYGEWCTFETDVALTDGEPPAGAGPLRGVERSLAFVRSRECAGTHR